MRCADMRKAQVIVLVIFMLSFLIAIGGITLIVISAGFDVFAYGVIGGMFLFYLLFLVTIMRRTLMRKFYKVEGGPAYGEVYVRDMNY